MRGWRGWLVAAMAGVSIGVLVGGLIGAVGGVITTAVGVVLLRRVEPAASRHERDRARAELPIAIDLVGAAMRCGAPVELAAVVVGEALGGPVGRRLVAVASALRSGVEPAIAWRAVTDVPGGERLALAAVRSTERGTALTRSLDRLASDLRADRANAAEAAARRVGVLVVLPLGLCFLPAFLLAGVVPVIVAVLGGLLGEW
jgi:Flp pilus assembly protein TadB